MHPHSVPFHRKCLCCIFCHLLPYLIHAPSLPNHPSRSWWGYSCSLYRSLKALLNLISLAARYLTSSISGHTILGCSPSNNAVLSQPSWILRSTRKAKLFSVYIFEVCRKLVLVMPFPKSCMAVGLLRVVEWHKQYRKREGATKTRQRMRQR